MQRRHCDSLCLIGGSEQIRTAVEGFADLCLATRPRNHTASAAAKINESWQASKTIARFHDFDDCYVEIKTEIQAAIKPNFAGLVMM